MIPVLGRDDVRAFDRCAIERWRVPGLVLMENAGRGATEEIVRVIAGRRRVVVVVGAGNNGGDGYVVARRLATLGYDARVFATTPGDLLRGDARTNHDACVGVGCLPEPLTDAGAPAFAEALAAADVIVDALLGTGLTRPVDGLVAGAIDRINQSAKDVVALDVPSGIDADTGAILGVAVCATVTCTFAFHKLGLMTDRGAEHAGRIVLVDIGVPSRPIAVTVRAELLESSDVARELRPRPLSIHKHRAGRVVVVAGALGTAGAALLVARGALRAGAGVVTIASFPDVIATLEARVLEAMTARIDPDDPASVDAALERADAVVLGPGLGLEARARTLATHVVRSFPGALVLDADGLTAFRGRPGELMEREAALTLTPHVGELARLLDVPGEVVEADRFGALARAVETTGGTVLLKGARTLVGVPGALPVINTSGSPALATAGSGDTLAGIVGAFACSLPPRAAAYAAAHVHGLAAEHWTKAGGGDRGLLAGEIADRVPGVLAELSGLESAVTD